MTSHAFRRALGFLLATCLCLLASTIGRADDEEKKLAAEVQAALLKLADGEGDFRDLARTSNFDYVMRAFKPRKRGGIGFGAVAAAGNDGIEMKLLGLARKPLTKEQLSKETPDLVRMAVRIRTVADVAEFYAPSVGRKPKDPAGKEWVRHTTALRLGAGDLLDVLRQGEPDKVKEVAVRVRDVCFSCHEKYRD